MESETSATAMVDNAASNNLPLNEATPMETDENVNNNPTENPGETGGNIFLKKATQKPIGM